MWTQCALFFFAIILLRLAWCERCVSLTMAVIPLLVAGRGLDRRPQPLPRRPDRRHQDLFPQDRNHEGAFLFYFCVEKLNPTRKQTLLPAVFTKRRGYSESEEKMLMIFLQCSAIVEASCAGDVTGCTVPEFFCLLYTSPSPRD